MCFVVVKGKLVLLVVLIKDDVRRVWFWYNDCDVRRFLSDLDGLFFFEDEFEWYEVMWRGKCENRVFIVLENLFKSLVGFVGLYRINYKDGYVELGYFIVKEYWNRGYVIEVVGLVLKYVFEWLNFRKVYVWVYELNIVLICVLEKNGFEFVGRMKKYFYIFGYGFVDELIFEKFREE